MKIQKRLVNSKRHTIGYMVGSSWKTKNQAIGLAEEGKIQNARVVYADYGVHIKGTEGRLEDLETWVDYN